MEEHRLKEALGGPPVRAEAAKEPRAAVRGRPPHSASRAARLKCRDESSFGKWPRCNKSFSASFQNAPGIPRVTGPDAFTGGLGGDPTHVGHGHRPSAWLITTWPDTSGALCRAPLCQLSLSTLIKPFHLKVARCRQSLPGSCRDLCHHDLSDGLQHPEAWSGPQRVTRRPTS